MVDPKQQELIKKLHEVLLDISEEALNDDEFYNWLNENYFFEYDLEEVILKVKEAKENI